MSTSSAGSSSPVTTRAAIDPAVYSPAPQVDLAGASSEFNSPTDLDGWRMNPGEPLVGSTAAKSTATIANGELQLVPDLSQWLNRHHGVGVAREVTGDLIVTARVLATGRSSPSSATDWSLSGIMLRAPLTAAGSEEWVHASVGFVHGPVVERKQTQVGISELTLIPVPSGWMELRLVRSGPSVTLLHRPDGGMWALDYTYQTHLPDTVELLLTGQTGAEGGPADLIGHIDWVHVAPSPLSSATAAGLAAGHADPAVVLAELPA